MFAFTQKALRQFSGTNVPCERGYSFKFIHSLSPCIYPILSFPYCNPTEEFFSIWRWKVHNRPHKQVPLLQAIDDVCNDHCQACICHARLLLFFPRCLTNENLWPNPQNRIDTKYKVQWGTLQLTCFCRPVVFSYSTTFFIFYLLRADYFINHFHILFKDSSVCTFLSSLLQWCMNVESHKGGFQNLLICVQCKELNTVSL